MRRPKRKSRANRRARPPLIKKQQRQPRKGAEIGDQVLNLLQHRQRSLSFAEILAELGLPGSAGNQLKKALRDLIRSRRLRQKGSTYALQPQGRLLTATLDVTAKGFGFATVDDQRPHEKDIFIPASELGGAVQGDTILVALTGERRGRREGRVMDIVQRAFTRLCGIFSQSGHGGFVTPDHDQMPLTIRIRSTHTGRAQDGDAVLVEILDYGSPARSPEGRVIELLGPPDSATVQIRMAMLRFDLPAAFPGEVLAEADRLTPIDSCAGGRIDLRELVHVTIDGETARDFDDAICVEHTRQGFRLHVSIADVSAYVRPGSALDREAYQRGTSVYLPDRVVPMLPERLSNDLCSLRPDEDRPAFTAILDFDRQGRRRGQTYTRSLIRSRHRLTYTQVNRLVFRPDQTLRTTYRAILPMLETAAELAGLLQRRRLDRGSLGFNLPEARIVLDGERVTDITLAERNKAHQLIEECMLAANEAVAETLERAGRAVLFRIHERPDPAKVEQFTETARAMGLQLPPTANEPAWFARVLEEASGTTAQYVINNLLLRTMQQARYATGNEGHFGLAAEHYLHFTSPIRRYPDLIAHRVLLAHLSRHQDVDRSKGSALCPAADLDAAGLHLSMQERNSVGVERNIHARLAVLFLAPRTGEHFAAVISGATSFGLFVELTRYYISGAIPLTTMRDDYYLHDSRGHRLIGEQSNKVYQLGMEIEVVLDHVDLASRQITFRLADGSN